MIQALFLQLAGPLHNVGTLFREIDQSTIDIEDLYILLNSSPKVEEKKDAEDFEFKEGKIKFQNLKFHHENIISKDKEKEPNKVLFEDFNLEIQPGTSNAIVGESGFGKTTLFNLLLRIYDPVEGQVTIDDQNVSDLKFDSFRKHIAVIPQNGALFNDSILFNLQYGNPDATLEEIQEVAKKCKIHDKIIQMEDGYQTQVGDLGGIISGGERQRLLIARALLKKDANIFLFDEATSNLDS